MPLEALTQLVPVASERHRQVLVFGLFRVLELVVLAHLKILLSYDGSLWQLTVERATCLVLIDALRSARAIPFRDCVHGDGELGRLG